jgi:hypothetical protein
MEVIMTKKAQNKTSKTNVSNIKDMVKKPAPKATPEIKVDTPVVEAITVSHEGSFDLNVLMNKANDTTVDVPQKSGSKSTVKSNGLVAGNFTPKGGSRLPRINCSQFCLSFLNVPFTIGKGINGITNYSIGITDEVKLKEALYNADGSDTDKVKILQEFGFVPDPTTTNFWLYSDGFEIKGYDRFKEVVDTVEDFLTKEFVYWKNNNHFSAKCFATNGNGKYYDGTLTNPNDINLELIGMKVKLSHNGGKEKFYGIDTIIEIMRKKFIANFPQS